MVVDLDIVLEKLNDNFVVINSWKIRQKQKIRDSWCSSPSEIIFKKNQGLQRVIYRNSEGESVRWSQLDIVLEKLKENLMVIKSWTISQKQKRRDSWCSSPSEIIFKKNKVCKEWISRNSEDWRKNKTKVSCYQFRNPRQQKEEMACGSDVVNKCICCRMIVHRKQEV